MTNIQPNYCSFEQCKLLKEKGFNVPTKNYYEYSLTSKKDKEHGYSGSFGWKKGECNLQEGYFINNLKDCDYSGKHWFMCSAPEQWQVHEWIETNFKLYVDTKCINSTRGDNFEYSIHKNNDTIKIKNGFDSRRESYSAAFDYILNNLI